jgi:hypothetical protein
MQLLQHGLATIEPAHRPELRHEEVPVAACNDYQSQHIVRQRVQGSYAILFTRANDGRLRLYQARPNIEAPFEDRG